MDVIVTHVNADFDALGGLVGARRLYPGSVMVLPGGEMPRVAEFLTLHEAALPVRTPAEIDPEAITRVVVVDTPSRKRIGPAAEWVERPGVEVDLYDHHTAEMTDLAPVFQRVEAWGSTSAIMVSLLREREEALTPIEATALLLGIYEDTGSFSFASTTAEDLEAAAWLVRTGGDLDVVARFSRHPLTPEQRELLRLAVDHLALIEVRGASIAIAPVVAPGHVENASVVASRLMEAEDVAAAVLLAEMDGTVFVIGRSRTDQVNVGAALRELGGGGHARAASARLKDEPLDAVRARLEAALRHSVVPEPTAREIMSYPVRTIPPDTTIAEARRRMIRYGHSGLVVTDEGRLAGIVTRRDLDKARHHRLEHAPVRSVMATAVSTAAPETPVSELEALMIASGIGRLPVVQGERILGIVTRTDVLRALHGARYLAGQERPAEDTPLQLLRERLPAALQELLEAVGQVAALEESHAYVVGGFVRDLLLGVKNLDVDILVEPDAVALARAVAADHDAALKVKGGGFGTAEITLKDGLRVDFATARTESYAHPGALPEVEPSSVLDDLRRRDFTINAMAVALRPERFGELLDPFGGRADLERRCIRALHNLSFLEDPTRIFRAIRFEERYHFRMDPHAEALARQAVASGALGRISPERLRRELFTGFREQSALGGIERLEELGVLRWLHPDLRLDERLFQGALEAAKWWKRHAREPVELNLLYLAAVLAPLGAKQAADVAAAKLRVSPTDLRTIEEALQAASQPPEVLSDAARPAEIYAAMQGFTPLALVLLRAALGLPGGKETAREKLERFIMEWRLARLEITGEELKRHGCRPGPAMGEALRRTLAAKLNGEIEGREAELAHALRLMGADAS
jgi:tRNA nucleotidyltransferase (CCA-adding enzyme)